MMNILGSLTYMWFYICWHASKHHTVPHESIKNQKEQQLSGGGGRRITSLFQARLGNITSRPGGVT
jgi:hypothetical protein